MSDIDYNRIQKIAEEAAKNAQHSLVTKTVTEVLKAYGIHDPQQMQRRMITVDEIINNKNYISRGFWGGLGSNMATSILTLFLAWAAFAKGLIG